MVKSIYQSPGCSQEDHLPNCGHFGYTGEYLSRHAKDCPSDQLKACTCNPVARAAAVQDSNQGGLMAAAQEEHDILRLIAETALFLGRNT